MDAVLEAREYRWQARQDLVLRFHAPVLTLRLNIPGPDKNPPGAEQAFSRLWDSLLARYRRAFVLYRRLYPAPDLIPYLYREHGTGADGSFQHLVSPLPAFELKRLAVDLEANHPLGRLADADVLDVDGRVVSRADMGLPPRACFVCSEQAALCRRLGRHRNDELIAFVREMLEQVLSKTPLAEEKRR